MVSSFWDVASTMKVRMSTLVPLVSGWLGVVVAVVPGSVCWMLRCCSLLLRPMLSVDPPMTVNCRLAAEHVRGSERTIEQQVASAVNAAVRAERKAVVDSRPGRRMTDLMVAMATQRLVVVLRGAEEGESQLCGLAVLWMILTAEWTWSRNSL